MNALGYANREDFVMEIIKTLFEGVVFAGALITLCLLMFVLEGLF